MKITRLTPEREAELPCFRQRYLDIACGGGRIDRTALEAALADAYAAIGEPAPQLLIFDSPMACMVALKRLQVQNNRQLRMNLEDLCRAWDHLADEFDDRDDGPLWEHIGTHLVEPLQEQLVWQLEK